MPLTFLCLAALAVDGDTLRCRDQGLVRIARIDAPEMPGHCRRTRVCAPGDGRASKARLTFLIAGQMVRCKQVDAWPDSRKFDARDRYGRIVAKCRVNGRDIGRTMIASGAAIPWP